MNKIKNEECVLTGNISKENEKEPEKDIIEKKKISGIYKIINKINGKYYVGSSCNILENNVGRWYHHKNLLNKNNHPNIHLQRAWNENGEQNFKFEIVKRISNELLLKEEQKYLDIANIEKNKCYNFSFIAGKIEMTDEIKNKIGIKTKQRLLNKENHPMFGKHHSKETIQKIKEKRKNQIFSPETIEKFRKRCGINNPRYGKGNNIIGSKNPNFDNSIYNFYNKNTKENYIGTKYDFRKKFNITTTDDLIKGRIKSTKSGWIFIHSL